MNVSKGTRFRTRRTTEWVVESDPDDLGYFMARRVKDGILRTMHLSDVKQVLLVDSDEQKNSL